MQEVLVFILFIGAIGFVGNIFRKSFKADSTSHGSCSACSSDEIKKLHNQISKGQSNG